MLTAVNTAGTVQNTLPARTVRLSRRTVFAQRVPCPAIPWLWACRYQGLAAPYPASYSPIACVWHHHNLCNGTTVLCQSRRACSNMLQQKAANACLSVCYAARHANVPKSGKNRRNAARCPKRPNFRITFLTVGAETCLER